jgi:signal transduction histidine kinase
MRWPIQTQLLLPMLSVVVLTIVLATITSAYFGGRWARRQQQEALARVVSSLTDANFPLSAAVLRRMSGLSGAEFALVDRQGQFRTATLDVTESQLAELRGHPSSGLENLPTSPVVELSGKQYLWARVPVHAPGNATDLLVVLYPEELLWTAAVEAMWPSLATGALSVIVVIAMTTLLARRFVQPIQRLGRQAEAITNGHFEPLPLSSRNDELRDLAVSMNTIAQRLTLYEQTVRSSERLRTLEQLGAGMAHQLRNWATGARMAMELHRRRCCAVEDESLDVALRQLAFMEYYVQRFLNIGRQPTERCGIGLANMVSEALSLVGPACEHGGVELKFAQSAAPAIEGDAEQLQQALLNLLLNAIEAASQRTNAQRRVDVVLDHESDWAHIAIYDSGAGPRETVRDRLFEPFVSEKAEGTGLGLAVAREIVEHHGGTLSWSRAAERTCFCIKLPTTAATAE